MLKGIVSYLFFMFICSYSISQQVSLFQSITTKDGLPSNYVFCAAEDSDGFLWIGTDKGLAKYDGFRWQLLSTDDGLPGNYIPGLFKADTHGLWVGISTKGLYYFNTITRKLIFVTDKHLNHFEQTDKEGNLFFYQNPELERRGTFDGFWVSPANPQKLNPAFKMPNGTWGNHLLTAFGEKKLYVEATAQHQIPDSKFFKLADDWKLDTIKITLSKESYLLNPVNATIISSDKSVHSLSNGKATKIAQASFLDHSYFNTVRYQNQTIACNEKEGVYFIKDDGSLKHYTIQDGLSSNLVNTPYVLSSGKLLLCTLGGGLCYKLPEGNATINTDGFSVKGMAVSNGNVFAVTERRLIRYNTKSMTAEIYPLAEKNIQGVDVWGNNIYISTLTGFTIYNLKYNILIRKDTVIRYAGISNVVESNGRLFAGTYGTHILEYKGKNVLEDSSSFAVSEKLQPIHNGLAAYNYEDGLQLNYLNGKKEMLTVKDGLPSNAVYHVHEHKDTLWISTKSGIAAYTGNRIVKTISAQQGINGNRCVYSFHDKNNTLWIVTDKYLGRYDGNKVTTYTAAVVKEGLNDHVHTALYDAKSNILFTGTVKSLFINNLNEVPALSRATSPVLSKIIYNSEPISDTVFSIPQQYDHLVFTFRPINVNPFSKAVLQYKLEGRDEVFSDLKDSLSVEFNKLRSGKYKLIAKTVNEEGVESETKVLCSFTVTSPFWQSNWFILFSVLASGLAAHTIATAYQKRKQKQKEREIKLEQQLLNERERISRELHDNLGSSLVTIIAQSDNIETKLRLNQPADALKKVQELNNQSRETMNILRETIWAVQEESHSFQSFASRIQDYLQRTFSVTTIECHCDVSGNLNKNLSPEQTLNVFRCIQECTQNIIKHSRASKANYILAALDEKLSIHINDNGKGFEVEKKYSSNGIRNIHSRIKELQGNSEITSAINKGTTINIEITV